MVQEERENDITLLFLVASAFFSSRLTALQSLTCCCFGALRLKAARWVYLSGIAGQGGWYNQPRISAHVAKRCDSGRWLESIEMRCKRFGCWREARKMVWIREHELKTTVSGISGDRICFPSISLELWRGKNSNKQIHKLRIPLAPQCHYVPPQKNDIIHAYLMPLCLHTHPYIYQYFLE